MTKPRSYQDVLDRGHVRDRDFRVTFGDSGIDTCLLVALHGGGIEPGTSELLRALAQTGNWAWYEFAGFLRKANHANLHITSTLFDEPTLLDLLPRTNWVLSLHGSAHAGEPAVYLGGAWDEGRQAIQASINAARSAHGIEASPAPPPLAGMEPSNVTNRGKLGRGIQLELSRSARNLLFPPDCSREARGRRSARLTAFATAIQAGLKQLR